MHECDLRGIGPLRPVYGRLRPGTDKDCGNWIINDSYVKNTEKAIVCRDAADRNQTSCKVYLKKVDPASMVDEQG